MSRGPHVRSLPRLASEPDRPANRGRRRGGEERRERRHGRRWALRLAVCIAASAATIAGVSARGSSIASAQPGIPAAPSAPASPAPQESLRRAAAAIDDGDYQQAIDLVAPLLHQPPPGAAGNSAMGRHDRAEAWRLYGLARFFLGQRPGAETAFLEYLKLDVDARLDPALVPPEAIVFFEDVRSRHAAELRRYRPRPRPRRYWQLNLVPVAGQMQNRHYRKGWLIAGAGAALTATHVTTYVLLDRWCDRGTGVCQSGDTPRYGAARSLRALNYASGIALAGLAVYAIVDGFLHYKRADDPTSLSIRATPRPDGGAQVGVSGTF